MSNSADWMNTSRSFQYSVDPLSRSFSSDLRHEFSPLKHRVHRLPDDEQTTDDDALGNAKQELDRCFDSDEISQDNFRGMNSKKNGFYHYEKNLLKSRHFVCLPSSIRARFDDATVKFGRVFPEINRVALVANSELFLWDYTNGSHYERALNMSQAILSIGLVKAKPGCFDKAVQYVLVVSSLVEILLLEVRPKAGELELRETDFKFSTDDVHITKIEGTSNGRIFLCGKDGHLYELEYHTSSGWFNWSTNCKKHRRSPLTYNIFRAADPVIDLSVDESRGLLWVLQASSTIMVFDLGKKLDSMDGPQVLSNPIQFAMKQLGIHADKTRGTKNEEWNSARIVRIFALSSGESRHVSCVAITNNAHRIFLHNRPSCSPFVSFVRMSPPAVQRPQDRSRKQWEPCYQRGQSPAQVEKVLYDAGILLISDSVDANTTNVVMISDDPDVLSDNKTRHYPQLNEAVESHPHQERVLSFSEMPLQVRDPLNISSLYRSTQQSQCLEGLSSFATQHFLQARQFLILTEQGLKLTERKRPVDELRDLLMEGYGGGMGMGAEMDASQLGLGSSAAQSGLQDFVRQHGPAEACAMLLLLLCEAPQDSSSHSSGLTYALDVSRSAANNISSTGMALSGLLTTNAFNALLHFGGHPSVEGNPVSTVQAAQLSAIHQQPSSSMQNFMNSGRHDGLYTYLGRLLRPVWRSGLFVVKDKDTPEGLGPRLNHKQVQVVLEPLLRLLNFADNNIHRLVPPPTLVEGVPSAHVRRIIGAERVETRSLDNFLTLLKRCVECMSLLLHFADCNDLPVITAKMEDHKRTQLESIQFWQVVVRPEAHTTIRGFLNFMIDQGATQVQSVQALSQKCPNFLGSSSVLQAEAVNKLISARQILHGQKRDETLEESVELYKRACKSAPFQFPIDDACTQLISVRHFPGVVELGLYTAQELRARDVDRMETETGRNTTPEMCYDIMTSCIQGMFQHEPSEAPSSLEQKTLTVALQSRDQAWHQALYSFLISNRSLNRIYRITHNVCGPHNALVVFLDQHNKLALLESYYTENGLLDQAAKVLISMSVRQQPGITLQQRHESLKRALLCKTQQNAQEIEEYAGLCDLQVFILEWINQQLRGTHLSDVRRNRLQELATRLNNALIENNEKLYHIAVDIRCWEGCIQALRFGEASDPVHIKNIYRRIIEEVIQDQRQRNPSGDWTPVMSDTLANLGTKFYAPHRTTYFPIEFIVELLERNRCLYLTKDARAEFIAQMLFSCRVEPLDQIQSYFNLTSKLISEPQNVHNPIQRLTIFYSVKSILQPLTHAASPQSDSFTQRRVMDYALRLLRLSISELNKYRSTEAIKQRVEDLLTNFQRFQTDFQQKLRFL